MDPFELEILIATDIADQLENARRETKWGFDAAVKYRCGVVKQYCENLIARLEEKLEKGK